MRALLRKDQHGQPLYGIRANLDNNVSKAFDQLSGICKGLLADGVVNEVEAQFFWDWLRRYSITDAGWALDAVVDRVKAIYADGVVTDDERLDLKAIMEEITGDHAGDVSVDPRSTALPLDNPQPEPIEFVGKVFSITGRFAFGTRPKVLDVITTRGGVAGDSMPTLKTDYLVIGTFASRDWIETSYGRKIERAVELRSEKSGIAIIGEDHWKRFV